MLVDLNLPVDLSYCTAVLLVDLNLAVLASTKFTGSTRRSSYTVRTAVHVAWYWIQYIRYL